VSHFFDHISDISDIQRLLDFSRPSSLLKDAI
jgi:hypothetical protein